MYRFLTRDYKYYNFTIFTNLLTESFYIEISFIKNIRFKNLENKINDS